jgi:NAD(P)-dependent dehydrogenase (short-subunit alcohol dehydrogenase family)
MTDFTGKVVVITGAAHGLGEATAKAFAGRGAKLALCDIDSDGLREVKDVLEARGAEVLTDIVDVSQASQVEGFSERVYKEFGQVDVLVNNAGVVLAGKLEDMKIEDWQWIIGINLWGVIHGAHYFYPRMRQRGSGHIVNISSAAALSPLPILSAYSGTKSAVLSMTRVWRAEGAVHGVGFTAVCPGVMNTNVSKSVRMCSETQRKFTPQSEEKAARFLASKRYDPARVAGAIVCAVEKNKSVAPIGFETHLVDLTNRFSRRLVDFVLKVSVRFSERWAQNA